MTNVCKLTPREGSSVDVDRIVALAEPAGSARLDDWLAPELEELGRILGQVATAYRSWRLDDVGREAREAALRAEALGLHRIARVARTTCVLSGHQDTTAFAANVARLLRLGDEAMIALWSLQDAQP